MEATIFSVINSLFEKGIITDTFLLLIIIAIQLLSYKYILRPIFDNIKVIDQFKKNLDEHYAGDRIELDKICKSLDKIIRMLEEIEKEDGSSSKDLISLKQDVEKIKQILNQFQGHLMYGTRRSSDFGNRELK